jgi:hypothetical protein
MYQLICGASRRRARATSDLQAKRTPGYACNTRWTRPRVNTLTIEEALWAYAAMMNTGDVSILEPLLAEEFHYASQRVFAEIESKAEYMAYIKPKLAAVRASGGRVWAEMGELDCDFPGPCVVLAQGDQDNLVALVLAQVDAGRITRLDLCIAPSPHLAKRTGEYPARGPEHMGC